jgi:hypothetical protein
MSKVYYPEEGLVELTRADNEEASRTLGNAISMCNFDIPWNFRFRDYLNGLRNTLDGYNNRLKEVREDIARADGEFTALSDRARANIDAMEPVDIKKREQLIQ